MGSCFSDLNGGKQAVGAHRIKLSWGRSSQRRRRFLLQLSLSAKNLRDMNILSKGDPMAVVYQKKRGGNLDEIGRTEVILTDLNPSWITKTPFAYQFETMQTLVFHVYDVDTKFNKLPVKDPFLRISRIVEGGQAVPIYKSEVIKNNLNPTWKCVTLSVQQYGSKVVGVEGIMNAYSSSLHNVTLSGPTLFGRVINRVAGIAARSQDSSKVPRDEISVVQALLEELPGQFLNYMRSRNIEPRTFAPSAPHTFAPSAPHS